MAEITYPTTLTNGTTPDADEVQGNFDAITAQVNGNLDEDNINPTANIPSGAIAFAADSISAVEIAAPTVTVDTPAGDSAGVTVGETVADVSVPSTGFYIVKAHSHFSFLNTTGADALVIAGSQVLDNGSLVGDASLETRMCRDGDTAYATTNEIEFTALTSGHTISLVHTRNATNLKTIAASTTLTIVRIA